MASKLKLPKLANTPDKLTTVPQLRKVAKLGDAIGSAAQTVLNVNTALTTDDPMYAGLERMKANVDHRIPLSTAAVRVLETQRIGKPVAEGALVFPAPRGGVVSDMVLTAFLRDQKAPSDVKGRVATAHGFRSSFRDWASENGYPRDLAEMALAHVISNETEAAYHRTDLLEQRRPMMAVWAAYIHGEELESNVVQLQNRA